jgi:hypothetical protein
LFSSQRHFVLAFFFSWSLGLPFLDSSVSFFGN